MLRLSFLFFLLVLSCADLFPQQTPASSWESLFRAWMTTEDAEYNEDTFDLLSSLAENPLNLNQLSREDLELLPFLSAQQVEDIMAYCDRYRPVRTLNELLMITSLDPDTRRLLRCFVTCGSMADTRTLLPSLSALAKDGRHTIMATVKLPMYERKGDRTAYLGYRYRHDLRYQFAYKNRLKFGITGAQDAGEPFLANRNRWGYDHYSYYFQLRHTGRLDELNLGMYRVQLGMGLLMNTGFHLGKLAVLQSLGRSSYVLTAHASRSAASYLRGAAATVSLNRHLKVTAFASYRPIDATLNDDGTIRTIDTDGYHRTATELAKKSNAHLTDLGLRLSWKPASRPANSASAQEPPQASAQKGLPFLNLNLLYTHFSRSIIPYTASASSTDEAAPWSRLYRRYALSGSSFFNASLDYGYTHYRFSFTGETAVNADGAIAALHNFNYRLNEHWTLMMMHRYYDKRYTAYHAYAFSEGNATQNEHGLYLGAKWMPTRATSLQAYIDYAYFPWARYQVSTASEGFDAMLLARTLLYNSSLEARYRFHLRQRDNSQHNLIQNRYEHRARLRLTIPVIGSSPTPLNPALTSLTLVTQADGAIVDNRTSRSRGIMITQQADYSRRWLHLDASVGWFHTDDYDSRLYQYEPSVLYDFSFPMFYGHGLRYSLTAKATLGRLMLAVKVGTTNYFDRSVISSGQQQIDRSSMTDVLLQLRLKL